MLDLDADLAPERFVSAINEHSANIVCLSALLTVTMPAMRTTIEALKTAGIREQVRILVSGAPVMAHYAVEVGADGYSESPAGAVALARKGWSPVFDSGLRPGWSYERSAVAMAESPESGAEMILRSASYELFAFGVGCPLAQMVGRRHVRTSRRGNLRGAKPLSNPQRIPTMRLSNTWPGCVLFRPAPERAVAQRRA